MAQKKLEKLEICRVVEIPGKGPETYTHDGNIFEVFGVTPSNIRALKRRFLPLEQKAFAYDDPLMAYEKIDSNIRIGTEVIFAREQGDDTKDLGAITQDMRTVRVHESEIRLLAIKIRAVLPEAQGQGIGTELGRIGLIRHRPHYVTGETRTWRVPRVNEKTGFLDQIQPVDGPLTRESQQILEVGLEKSELKNLDLATGVRGGVYLPGRSEHLKPPDPKNTRGVEIDQSMRQKMNPEDGDVLRYFSRSIEEAIEVAAPKYIAGRLRAGTFLEIVPIGRLTLIQAPSVLVRIPTPLAEMVLVDLQRRNKAF